MTTACVVVHLLQMLEAVFRATDTDNSNSIELDEFLTLIKSLELKTSAEQVMLSLYYDRLAVVFDSAACRDRVLHACLTLRRHCVWWTRTWSVICCTSGDEAVQQHRHARRSLHGRVHTAAAKDG